MKKTAILLVAVGLMLTTGAALAQSTFSVPFSAVGGSGVEGSGVLTAAGQGTDVSLDITGLTPNSTASAALHAGSCAALSASFAELPALTADSSGRATASGQVLFRGTESVALSTIADGEHVIAVSHAGKMVSCAWIPKVEYSQGTPGMPSTGEADLFPIIVGSVAVAIVAIGGALVLREARR